MSELVTGGCEWISVFGCKYWIGGTEVFAFIFVKCGEGDRFAADEGVHLGRCL